MVLYTTNIEEMKEEYNVLATGDNVSYFMKKGYSPKKIIATIRSDFETKFANCLNIEERVEVGDTGFIIKGKAYYVSKKRENYSSLPLISNPNGYAEVFRMDKPLPNNNQELRQLIVNDMFDKAIDLGAEVACLERNEKDKTSFLVFYKNESNHR